MNDLALIVGLTVLFAPVWVVAYSGGCMLSSAHAQIIAQLARPIVFAVRAVWFAVPALRGLGKAKALIAIVSAHLFRYVTLLMYSAKHDGYAISDIAAAEAVIGDIAGAAVGLVTLGSLAPPWAGKRRAFLAVGCCERCRFHCRYSSKDSGASLWGAASGVTWLIPNFCVPLLMVSLPVLIRQLCARMGERFGGAGAKVGNGA